MYRRTVKDRIEEMPLWQQVAASIRTQGVPAYLVGGTVRDALLGRRICDLDIAVQGEAMTLARRVADDIHGAYVPMDAEHDVARVVVRVGSDRGHVDLAGLRGEGIEADLWARDYTVNAMAVALDEGLGPLIDPVGGQADLAAGVLRMVYEGAFKDDPLRILRGVRLRGALGFALTPEAEALARAWLPALRRVSAERIRDELAQILALDDAAESLSYAHRLGVLGVIFPELAADDSLLIRGTQAVAVLEGLFGPWMSLQKHTEHPDADTTRRSLGRYRTALAQHEAKELSGGRTRWIVTKLAALLSALPDAPQGAPGAARRLHLSAREVRQVAATLRAEACEPLWSGGKELRALTIHRYYRDVGAAGVDGALLRLASRLAGSQEDDDPSSFETCLSRVERLLGAWFQEHDRFVEPPQLLSGRDLMHLFDIGPGPEIGRLLQHLCEAQVQSLVHTRDEAIDYLRPLASEP